MMPEAAIPVVGLARDTALEVEDLALEAARLARADAVAGRTEDAPLQVLGLAIEAPRFVARQHAAVAHHADVHPDALHPAFHRTGEVDAVEPAAEVVRIV